MAKVFAKSLGLIAAIGFGCMAASSPAHADPVYGMCGGYLVGDNYLSDIFILDGESRGIDNATAERWAAEFKAVVSRTYGVQLPFANCWLDKDRQMLINQRPTNRSLKPVAWKPGGTR